VKSILESAIQPRLHSPLLPEIVASLQSRVHEEAERRRIFYEDLRDDQKAEFVDGQVILHSPARDKHLAVRQNLERLLGYLALKFGSGEIASPTVPGFRIPIRSLFDPADNLAALRQLMTAEYYSAQSCLLATDSI
jgi:hypothetical protein